MHMRQKTETTERKKERKNERERYRKERSSKREIRKRREREKWQSGGCKHRERERFRDKTRICPRLLVWCVIVSNDGRARLCRYYTLRYYCASRTIGCQRTSVFIANGTEQMKWNSPLAEFAEEFHVSLANNFLSCVS